MWGMGGKRLDEHVGIACTPWLIHIDHAGQTSKNHYFFVMFVCFHTIPYWKHLTPTSRAFTRTCALSCVILRFRARCLSARRHEICMFKCTHMCTHTMYIYIYIYICILMSGTHTHELQAERYATHIKKAIHWIRFGIAGLPFSCHFARSSSRAKHFQVFANMICVHSGSKRTHCDPDRCIGGNHLVCSQSGSLRIPSGIFFWPWRFWGKHLEGFA